MESKKRYKEFSTIDSELERMTGQILKESANALIIVPKKLLTQSFFPFLITDVWLFLWMWDQNIVVSGFSLLLLSLSDQKNNMSPLSIFFERMSNEPEINSPFINLPLCLLMNKDSVLIFVRRL